MTERDIIVDFGWQRVATLKEKKRKKNKENNHSSKHQAEGNSESEESKTWYQDLKVDGDIERKTAEDHFISHYLLL